MVDLSSNIIMQPLVKCSTKMKNIFLFVLLLYIIISSVQATKLETNRSKSALHYQDNFKPLTLPQTKSQKLIKELSAKINARQPDFKKQQQDYNMVSLNTHETQAPSTLSSFYNMMSRKPSENKEQKSNERNQQQTSAFQQFVDPQAQMYSQQSGMGGPRNVGGVASRTSQTTEFNTPLIFASGNNLQVSNPVDGPQIFEQTMTATPANSPTGQEPIEGFYVNSIGSQPMLQEQTMSQELGPNSLAIANQLAMQGNYAAQQHQQHQRKQQQANQLNFGPSANYYSQELTQQPVSPYEVDKQAAYYMGLVQPNQQHYNKQLSKQTKLASTNKSKKKEMLTNEQLVTLINELKEFNSKQSGKMSKGAKNHLRELTKPIRGNNSDNERLFTEIVKSINKSRPASSSRDSKSNTNNDYDESEDEGQSGKSDDNNNRRSEDDDGDVSSEDLAKLAKRLVSGKRPRSWQSRRRSSTSVRDNDEDEDMKDALLENEKKTTKRNSKQEKDPVDQLKEKQQAEVDSRLENIIQEVANRKRKMDKKKEDDEQKENDKEQKDDKQDDDAEYADKARRRRDHPAAGVGSSQQASSKEVRTIMVEPGRAHQHQKGRKINKSLLEKGHQDNLAKALIKTEMSIDKKDGQDSPLETRSQNNQPLQQFNGNNPQAPPPFQPDKMDRRSDETLVSGSLVNSSDEGGEEKLKYPKSERNKDQESLKQSLKKARAAKFKMSSRIPIPMEKIVKKALNGEMEKLAEANPEAKLKAAGDGGTSISLRHPSTTDADESDNQSSDEGVNKSDLVPEQVEPEKGSDASSIGQSEKQLKDEYPISDRVSDRLNKLSHNLDRYFNDGFLQEVEQKSQPDGSERKQSAASQQHLQLATTTNSNAKENENSKVMRKDHDFDIDVAIDGKRDIPDPDEDDANMEITEEPEDVNGKRKTKNRKRGKGEKLNTKKRDRRSKASTKDSRSRKRKLTNPMKPKTLKINDPVENETLDTPIGPDGDDFPGLGVAKKTKGSKEKQTNFGRKLTDKFYQEPD